MKPVTQRLARYPWSVALIAAAGVTLLVPSAFALFAPGDWLDAAVALGDRTLEATLAALFAGSAGLARLLLLRRRDPAESVEQRPPPAVEDPGARPYLR